MDKEHQYDSELSKNRQTLLSENLFRVASPPFRFDGQSGYEWFLLAAAFVSVSIRFLSYHARCVTAQMALMLQLRYVVGSRLFLIFYRNSVPFAGLLTMYWIARAQMQIQAR